MINLMFLLYALIIIMHQTMQFSVISKDIKELKLELLKLKEELLNK